MVERHRRACDGFSVVADVVAADRWNAPTPCTEWDARALVEHVIGFHEFLILRPLGIRAQRPRDDPAARWRATAAALFDFLETDGAADRESELPGGGTSSPRQVLGALTTDVLVHTWDLAIAVGAEPRLDPDLCAAALTAAAENGLRRADGMIGPEVVVGAGVDAETRLAALYGRDPGWTPAG